MAKDVKSLREKAVAYMTAMSAVKWTPEEDVDLSCITKKLYYHKGETYYGIIYNTNEGEDLESFESYLHDGVYKGPYTKSEIPGNHCTSSILITWRKLGDKVSATYTANMMPQSKTGVLPIGNYDWREDDTTTIQMVDRTDADTMYECYALLQPADAVLYCFGASGHARMVKEVHVVRGEDGKINPEESYIITIEQTSSFDKQREDIKTTWYIDHKYSFASLYEKKYVTITVPIFQE